MRPGAVSYTHLDVYKRQGYAPAPYRAIDLMEKARTCSREDGFEGETVALEDLMMSEELRAGLYAFDLVQKRAKRPAGAPEKSLARKICLLYTSRCV